jgi:hypothetical protein
MVVGKVSLLNNLYSIYPALYILFKYFGSGSTIKRFFQTYLRKILDTCLMMRKGWEFVLLGPSKQEYVAKGEYSIGTNVMGSVVQ